MTTRLRFVGAIGVTGLFLTPDFFACGDKFLKRSKNASWLLVLR